VYIGPLFNKNRAYAQRFATDWIILSAKYGLIAPSFVIPGPYDVTFAKAKTHPIVVGEIAKQAAQIDLAAYDVVVGLGGKVYCAIVATVFRAVNVEFPFLGLRSQGAMMHEINRALDAGRMIPPR